MRRLTDDERAQRKIERAAYQREYRSLNAEKIAATKAAHRAQNAERIAASFAAWYESNKERHLARTAEWRAANKSRMSAYSASHYAANKQQRKEYLAEWHRKNPEARSLTAHRRRARKAQAGGSLSNGIRRRLMGLQRHCCANCATDLRVSGSHLDHIVPLALGGPNEDSNVQLLCPTCNLRKNRLDPIEWAQRNGRLL